MIELGDKVKDTVTGFSGIAVCRSTYLQGCVRFGVQGQVTKNEAPAEWQYFDEPQLKVVKKNAIKQGNKKPGGYKPDNAMRKH